MEQGSLPERYLSRSVIKHIRKQNKALVTGTAVGNDYSLMDNQVSADGTGKTPFTAWIKAMNNFACSGGKPQGARLVLLLPAAAKESWLKQYMSEFNELAEACGVQILGGHSEVSEMFSGAFFVVTIVGNVGSFRQNKKAIAPGFHIVMTGFAGCLGTDLLARENLESLKNRFAESYIREAFYSRDEFSIAKAAGIMADYDLCYMHDVSHGGVYGGLWQLGVWMDKGFEIDHFAIPIKQETIELCEFFGVNPYLLDGTGSMLAVLSDGSELVEKLKLNGIEAAVIGQVTEGREKLIVMNETDKRCLSPVNGDAIYHIEATD